MKKPLLTLVKVGGAVLEKEDSRKELLQKFAALDGPKVLIHGGGREASQLSEELGRPAELIEGRRITDDFQLKVAVMVYAGAVNKQVVAELQSLECQAIGLSGADGNLIQAVKRPVGDIDYGWVGDIIGVNATLLQVLLQEGYSPVLCALTHNGEGNLLNTNADTIASEVAGALQKHFSVRLLYCFEHAGVLAKLSDPDSLFPELWESELNQLLQQKIVHAGMKPKLHTGFKACQQGVEEVWIGNQQMLQNGPVKGTRLRTKSIPE